MKMPTALQPALEKYKALVTPPPFVPPAGWNPSQDRLHELQARCDRLGNTLKFTGAGVLALGGASLAVCIAAVAGTVPLIAGSAMLALFSAGTLGQQLLHYKEDKLRLELSATREAYRRSARLTPEKIAKQVKAAIRTVKKPFAGAQAKAKPAQDNAPAPKPPKNG